MTEREFESNTLEYCNALVQTARKLLDDRARASLSAPPKSKAWTHILKAAAGAGAIDQILVAQLGVGPAALLEIAVTVLAQRMQDESETVRKISRQVDVLLSEKQRIALESFAEALELIRTERAPSHLRDAGQCIAAALANLDERHLRDLLSDGEFYQLSFVFGSMYALCATLDMDIETAQRRFERACEHLREQEALCREQARTLQHHTIPALEADRDLIDRSRVLAEEHDIDRTIWDPTPGAGHRRAIYIASLKKERRQNERALSAATSRLQQMQSMTLACQMARDAFARAALPPKHTIEG
jgi:hypothetical protein